MYKTFIKQIAGLQIILGAVMAIPIVVALVYGEWYSLLGFLLSSVITATLGYLGYNLLKNSEEPQQKHALAIAALGWLMVVVFGALPFIMIAYLTPLEVMNGFIPAGATYDASSLINFRNPLHAIFESCSGFTTTGLTMSYNEPSVGKSVLFYRSLSNWIGGAGFIVMALAVFRPLPGVGSVALYGSEASGVKLQATVFQTARSIWKAYVTVSLICFAYILVGTFIILPDYPISDNIFDAINHTMAALSTGGFSPLDDSIMGYNSLNMEMLMIPPMLIGGFSLPLFYRMLFLKQYKLLLTDIQSRALFFSCIIGSIGLSLFLMRSTSVAAPWREGVFQYISAITTTGWQTSNIGDWDNASILLIVFTAMIIGGCYGGTVGGVKIIRVLILQKGLFWQVNKVFMSNNSIKSVKFNNKILLPEEMNSELSKAAIFVLVYLVFVFISTLMTVLLTLPDFTLSDAIFEAASAQGTVGLSTGITDPSMSPILETIYIVQMLAGRLEIIPVLLLVRVIILGTKSKII